MAPVDGSQPAGGASDIVSRRRDAFTPWYTVWTGAFLLLLGVSHDLDRIFKLWLLLVPIIALPALVWAATMLIGLAVNAFKRRWRRVISILAAPIIALAFFSVLARLGLTDDRIRFELGKSDYQAQVDALPASDDGIRIKTWDWGETGGAGVPNFFWTLVYDDSDQIALPPSSWSAQWVEKTGQVGSSLYSVVHQADDKSHSVRVRHVVGHFYVVEELYP
jgi:hypothetical protein